MLRAAAPTLVVVLRAAAAHGEAVVLLGQVPQSEVPVQELAPDHEVQEAQSIVGVLEFRRNVKAVVPALVVVAVVMVVVGVVVVAVVVVMVVVVMLVVVVVVVVAVVVVIVLVVVAVEVLAVFV